MRTINEIFCAFETIVHKRNVESDFLSFDISYIKRDNRFAESNLRGSYISISRGYFYSKILAWWIVNNRSVFVFSVDGRLL